jgi:hypothetical protein
MSLKSIFSSVPKVVASQSLDTLGTEIESAEFIEQKQIDISKFVPPVDYSSVSSFAKFGLASKYYTDSYTRISQQYPYDGSLREKTQFFNTSSNFDKWIYDNKYPRFTGFVTISPTGWGNRVGSLVGGYGRPSTLSYIYIKGGPNTSGSTLVDKFKYSNFYSQEYKRASNLDYDLTNGVTLEFWLNKSGFDSTKTEKEVIFDLWNNQVSSSTNYGRLTLELTSSTSAASTFYLTAQSGTSGFTRINIGDITVSQLTSSGWNQYSVILKNSGSSINTKFYVNGQLNDSVTSGTSLQPVTGAMLASVGSLVTAFSGTATDIGWGKLSGSLDEFRYWKTARTEQDIQYYWFTNVNGGTNVDDANTDLGVYYKFNEGIVSSSAIDSIVLDYSGRISNGSFVGYESACRSTGSAFVLYGLTEEADPVIYNTHPDYTSSLQTLIDDSFEHDTQNNAAMYNYIPQWIREDEDQNGEGLLPNLIQTMAVYFDNLYHQIDYNNKIKNIQYTSGSDKPIPFANRLIENYGLITPEIFVESEIAEFFANRTDTLLYSGSLTDVKNKIYINIYNNLVNILKSKGTEKAYRNLIRCFGVDAELIKMNLYADNTTYKLQDNSYSTAVKKKFVDFNDTDRFDTTVYQYADASITSSLSYIPGNVSASYMGMTAETEVIFPRRFTESEPLYFEYGFLSSSLFGMHEANSASVNDLTWHGTDDINFQVYAVRPEKESKNVYFQLTDYSGSYVNLTSSVYVDVYNNSKWNFAVRVRPNKHENIDLINDTSGSTYTLEFYGVKTNLDTIESEFLLTQSLDNTRGKNFFTKAKRFYVGSHVLNFTSSQNVITTTDTKISTLKYWQTYLDDDVITAHSKDASNYGSLHAYRNAYNPSITSISGTFVPQIETLALNWDFTTITSSDNGDGNPTNKVAQFIVPDATSGSLELINRYGWLGDILNHQYTGRGDFFLPNDDQVVNVEYVFSAKQQLPESLDSLDTIQVLSQDDLVFTRETRPQNYYYTFEKSMYQNISEEMLNMFGTIIEFNNLIGEPVNRYRQEYKDMSKLRQLFFERVQNTPSLDKFIDLYKWLDSAISVFIAQLTPASANVSDKIFNVIESHILERNKYWNKFPTIEFKGTDPEAGAQSINKLLYNWKFGHRPLSGLEADNADYWLNRAERDTAPLSSSISASNFARSTILSVAVSALNRRYTTPTRYIVEETKQIKGGTNLHKNNKVEFLKIATAPHGPMDTDDLINIPANYLFVGVENTSSLLKDINDVKDPNKKIKYHFNVVHGRDYVSSSLGYGEVLKSDIAIPANFISGNITSGYNAQVSENFMSGVIITNIHNDVYGNDKEKPMQGPFTDRWVGGLQYRHVDINRGTDGYTTRPEGWKLLLGQLGTSSYQATLGFVGADYPYPEGNPDEPSYPVRAHLRAPYYRETTAKRPVNIRNIQYSTSSYSLGNFRSNYEAIHSVGRTTNNSLLIDQTGTINLAQTELKTILRTEPNDERVDFTLPTRTAYKTIIGNRFSAPGEIRTLSRGYLNRFAEELSAYNAMPFRNKQVIGDARRVNDNLTIESSSYTPEIIEGTIGYNYNQLLSRHADFGGLMSGSATIPSIHKVNRNPVYRFNDVGLVTNYNNGFVSYQIPRKDSGYAWITASLTQGITSGNVANFGHVNNFVTTPQGTSSVIQTIPFVTNTDVGLNSAGHFVLTGATNTIDSVGLNSVIVEETGYDYLGSVSASLSSLTSSIVTSVTSEAGLFNALMVVRNGLYQYPTFKQLYRSTHPSVRLQIKNSQFGNVDTTTTTVTAPLGNQITVYSRNSNRFFTEPFVVYRKPILSSLEYNDGKTLNNVQFTFSNQNETEYFCDDEFNYLLGLTKCYHQSYKQVSKLYLNGALQSNISPISKFNSLRYEENIYPAAINKFKKVVRKRTSFDNQFWRDAQTNRITQNNSSSFGGITIASQSMWSLDAQTSFNSRTTASAGVSSVGNGAGLLQNNHSFYYSNVTSASLLKLSPLFNRKHMVQNIRSHVAPTGIGLPTASSPIPIGFGEAYWSAAQNANVLNNDGSYSSSSINPFYNSYDEYADDISYIGKNGSLIPEFRIENKIDDYLTSKDINVLNDLQIIGGDTNYSNNTTNTFYKTFTNTEFMKNFSVIKEDHKELVDPFKITLECNAYIKFVPYKGFYPADRTVDIATTFSSSYLPYVSSSLASSSFITASIFDDNVKHRNFITPFIAPGILYNSIKSGIAVDYALLEKPVLDSDLSSSLYSYKAIEVSNADGSGSNVMIMARNDNDALINKRLPFEAILQPEKYVKNTTLYDFESHPSASTNLRYKNFVTQISGNAEDGISTSILKSDGDNKYKYMINNFLAETVNFFLLDQQLSSITSKAENTLNLNLTSGSVYGARLKMYRSLNQNRNFFPLSYELPQDPDGNLDYILYYNIIDEVPSAYTASLLSAFKGNKTLSETFTMYSRPTAFGPDFGGSIDSSSIQVTVKNISNFYTRDARIGFNPIYTPPYYYGESWADIVFKATETKQYTIQEIIQNSNINYLRFDTRVSNWTASVGDVDVSGSAIIWAPTSSQDVSGTYSLLTKPRVDYNSMQLSASLNIQNYKTIVNADYDPITNNKILKTNDTTYVWNIETKFETPMLNFNDVTLSSDEVPTIARQTVPVGMWHQFGKIPQDNEGIFMKIEPISQNWLQYHPAAAEGSYYNASSSIKDLTQLVGFSTEPVKLGKLQKTKKVYEAVVAVPFVEENGVKKFFEIPKVTADIALGLTQPSADGSDDAGNTIKQLSSYLDKYVFPPMFDFKINKETTPVSMYVFEFDYDLNQNDLSYVWQNLPPVNSRKVEKKTATISHKLLYNELMGHANALRNQTLDSNIQWMVFKVKQRAKVDYTEYLGAKVVDTDNSTVENNSLLLSRDQNLFTNVKYSYNWPYDFFSLVELAEMKATIDLEPPDEISQSSVFVADKLRNTTGNSLVDGNLAVQTNAETTNRVRQSLSSQGELENTLSNSITQTNTTVKNLAASIKKGLK